MQKLLKIWCIWILIISATFYGCNDNSNITKPKENNFIESEFLPEIAEDKSWELVWHDEFDGEQLDSTKWAHISWVEPGQDQPRKDGFWREDAAILNGNGHLKMLTYYDDEKQRYIDGGIRTKGQYHKKYGYFEIRVKFQEEIGHWSAFWLMNDDVATVGDAGTDGTEVDIFEKINPHNNKIYHTLHWDGYGSAHQSDHKLVDIAGLNEGFHNIGLWWTSEKYRFYIDGKLTWTTKSGGVCKSPLYIQITDEVGTWADDIKSADLPDNWLVDYVRVYDLVEN